MTTDTTVTSFAPLTPTPLPPPPGRIKQTIGAIKEHMKEKHSKLGDKGVPPGKKRRQPKGTNWSQVSVEGCLGGAGRGAPEGARAEEHQGSDLLAAVELAPPCRSAYPYPHPNPNSNPNPTRSRNAHPRPRRYPPPP